MTTDPRDIYPGEVQNGVGIYLIGAYRGGTQGDGGNDDNPLRDTTNDTLAAAVLEFAMYQTDGHADVGSNVNVYVLPEDGEVKDDARNRHNPANASNFVDLRETGNQFQTFEVHGGQDFGEGTGNLAIGSADDRVLVEMVGHEWTFEMDEIIAVEEMTLSPLGLITIDVGARSDIIGQRAEIDGVEDTVSELAQTVNEHADELGDEGEVRRGADTTKPEDGGGTPSSGGRMILEGALKLLRG